MQILHMCSISKKYDGQAKAKVLQSIEVQCVLNAYWQPQERTVAEAKLQSRVDHDLLATCALAQIQCPLALNWG